MAEDGAPSGLQVICPHCGGAVDIPLLRLSDDGSPEIPASMPASDERREPSPELRALQADYRQLLREYQEREEPRRPGLADFATWRFTSESTLKRHLRAAGAVWTRDFARLCPLSDAE